MQPNQWLPLTEYALRSGMSISTLRRKIKSNAIDYRMEDGRYLIRADEVEETNSPVIGFASSDAPRKIISMAPAMAQPVAHSVPKPAAVQLAPPAAIPAPEAPALWAEEIQKMQHELRQTKDESSLRWRALEARVAGLAKRLDLFSEQMAEVKMLVKIFEEKLDERA